MRHVARLSAAGAAPATGAADKEAKDSADKEVKDKDNKGEYVTRRPPRRAPCLARHYQVTMRASFNVSAQANLDRNCPSGMGDRRVGT